MARGKFITLEGIEGAGKSTQTKALAKQLEARGISCTVTCESGGTELGMRLMELIRDEALQPMCVEAELLLHFAARAEHVRTLIEPALAAGHWVISDRFVDSSFAYQGAGAQLGEDRVATIAQWVLGDLTPDRVIVLDIEEAPGAKRVQRRGALDWYEKLPVDFFTRARQCFQDRAAANPETYRVIDAMRPVEQVQQDILDVALELLE